MALHCSPEDFLRLTIDLFGESIIDGDDPSLRPPIGQSGRKQRVSPEMGTVFISEDGDIQKFQPSNVNDDMIKGEPMTDNLSRDQFASPIIWRKAMIPYIINNTNRLHQSILHEAKKARRIARPNESEHMDRLGESIANESENAQSNPLFNNLKPRSPQEQWSGE